MQSIPEPEAESRPAKSELDKQTRTSKLATSYEQKSNDNDLDRGAGGHRRVADLAVLQLHHQFQGTANAADENPVHQLSLGRALLPGQGRGRIRPKKP